MTMTETTDRPANGTTPPNTTQPGRALTPVNEIKAGLERMRPQLKVALPAHITPERFERVVLSALNNDPDLITADRRSFFNAASKAAQDGLLPDKREGALVIYNDKNGKRLVQWMPMVFGLIKLMRQSGEIEDVGARIVFQNEIDSPSPTRPNGKRFEFFISEGRENLIHEPMLWGDRGEKVLVYAYARFKNGHIVYKPMHRADVLKRKKASRAQSEKSPWNTWEDEMWLKTAIRVLAKTMPLSAEVMRAVDRDEEPTTFDRLKHEAQNIADAATQFAGQPLAIGGPDDVDDPDDAEDIDDGEAEAPAEDVIGDESSLDRGVRLLGMCKTVKDVNDLQVSITEELSDAEVATFDQYVATRRKEIVGK